MSIIIRALKRTPLQSAGTAAHHDDRAAFPGRGQSVLGNQFRSGAVISTGQQLRVLTRAERYVLPAHIASGGSICRFSVPSRALLMSWSAWFNGM